MIKSGFFVSCRMIHIRFVITGLLVFLAFIRLCAQQTGGLMETTIDTAQQRRLTTSLLKFEFLRISGYMQPQFQIGQTEGQFSFNGGDFGTAVSNRFSVRRGRLRFDYTHYNDLNQATVLFVFQFDCTERGVFTRDFWGRFYENKYQLVHFTTGMFARPFGFELNYGSADRESPERGRMSQLLMRTERDLGAMISFEPRTPNHPLRKFRIDAGFFNGQGLTGITDYDSKKDFISRLSLKPVKIGRTGITVTGSLSGFLGGFRQFTNNIYRNGGITESPRFALDSSAANMGKTAPRRYYGADVQLRIPNRKGFTELRGEVIAGTQTASQFSTESPGSIPTQNGLNSPLFVRNFNGAYFYFLQHLGSIKHQFVAKYDWYDPNTHVRGRQIRPDDKTTGNIGYSWANIRYNTLGLGYVYYVNENLKSTVWYEFVRNEKTSLPGFESDAKDNLLTLRLQYRF